VINRKLEFDAISKISIKWEKELEITSNKNCGSFYLLRGEIVKV